LLYAGKDVLKSNRQHSWQPVEKTSCMQIVAVSFLSGDIMNPFLQKKSSQSTLNIANFELNLFLFLDNIRTVISK